MSFGGDSTPIHRRLPPIQKPFSASALDRPDVPQGTLRVHYHLLCKPTSGLLVPDCVLWWCHLCVSSICLHSGLPNLRGQLSHLALDLPCPSAGCHPCAGLTCLPCTGIILSLCSAPEETVGNASPRYVLQLALPSPWVLARALLVEFSERCETDQCEFQLPYPARYLPTSIKVPLPMTGEPGAFRVTHLLT